MLGHRELTIDDYLEILRRRYLWLFVPILFGPILGYAYSLTIPSQYTSTSLIVVEGQKVPEGFVRSVVTDGMVQRLGSMQQQILSRTRLQPIIERYGLYKDDIQQMPMEDVVEKMRKSISLAPARTPSMGKGPNLPAFTIAFTADNPRMAQEVCAQLTTMFIEEDLRIREERAKGTTDFLQKQLDEAKRKIEEQDQKLAEFKRRYLGQLPGQESNNLGILISLNTQLEANTQALNRTHQDKAYAESLLAQQVAAWEASQTGSDPQSLEKQLVVMQNQLVSIESRYTSAHPDVTKLNSDIELMQKRIEEAKATAAKAAPGKTQPAALTEPAHILQFRNQIRLFGQAIEEKTQAQQRLQQQIKLYQDRVQLSPVVEQEYKELTRDYQIAQKFYDELLAKRTQSEMSADMERQQQGEQFRLMDPSTLPGTPSSPNRLQFAGGGLGAGFVVGMGIVVLIEMRDRAIRSERDVEFFLELPTLALIPVIDSQKIAGKNGNRQRFRLARSQTNPGKHIQVQ